MEDVPSPLPEGASAVLAEWVRTTAAAEGKTTGEISFILCSDEYLLHINQSFLEHDYYTDVITFPYHETADDPIEGDVYISVERTTENAMTAKVAPLHELCRVVIHGTLHLCGYDDATPELRQAMHLKENYYLEKMQPIWNI